MSGEQRLHVGIEGRSYDIVAGSGLLPRAAELIQAVRPVRRLIIVTDATVAGLHLKPLLASLDAAGIAHHEIVLPPGEGTKDFAHYAKLSEEILSLGIERGTLLVALGGGVVGDLTGLTAATLLRGIDFVQIPTTLLAQVDSSVGGKTGINTPQGKNLVGAFHQPVLVLADIDALETLPRREFLAGYAEVVKYGIIRDPAFFAWLEGQGASLVRGDRAARLQAVVESCQAKATVVAADERETGDRALLNFGHTFGHALESEVGYSDELLHGEAVAIGSILAFDMSVRLGFCPAETAARVRRHFEAVGLPTRVATSQGRKFTTEALIAHMQKDKKVKDGKLTFILTRGIGQAFITRDVGVGDLRAVLDAAVAS